MQKILFTVVFYILHSFLYVQCAYPPIGDEIHSGTVLLPASRRGRYLANIIRRQAVDGTEIKFNKAADRMNAEAKKKVDVLSDELLPYIIAEQERRTTLYKRVMTALQNGEKGVTIAEIRNKPPIIIRKGFMYRCPSNRAPIEPDGSGMIMCEDRIQPTPIIYDSCLSAEDKELYNADNKYFFCNRHKVEGPELPRNGSTVIACPPCERTSFNYTTAKCALENTDDVVVHYRYYPDKTYKFVTELDPDREMCEHWNPCQIGYIFSLPSPDQATPATDLWPDYVLYDEDFEKEEIVPEIPDDMMTQYVRTPVNYKTCTVKVNVPMGMTYDGIILVKEDMGRQRLSIREGAEEIPLETPAGGHPIRISDEDGVVAQFQNRITVKAVSLGVHKLGIWDSIKGTYSKAKNIGASAVKGVYHGGKYVVDKTIKGTKQAADKVYEGGKYVGGKVIEGGKYVGGKVIEGGKYVGEKVIEGGKYVGEKVYEGGKYVGEQVYEGGKYVGEKVYEGGKYVGEQVYEGGKYVGEKVYEGGKFAGEQIYQGGKYVAEGVSSGINEMGQMVQESIKFGASVEVGGSLGLMGVSAQMGFNIEFSPMRSNELGNYYVGFKGEVGLRRKSEHKYVLLFSFAKSTLNVIPVRQEYLPTQTFKTYYVNISCTECYVKKILLKTEDAIVNLVSPSKYKFYKMDNFTMLELRLEKLMFEDFGLYFMFVHLAENYKEKIKFLTIFAPDADDENLLGITRLVGSVDPGEQFEETLKYECHDCELTEVLCQGQNFIETGRVTIIPHRKEILFNLPSFEDSHSCVYTSLFTKGRNRYRKILAVIDNKSDLISISPPHLVIPGPPLGDEDESIEQTIQYKCKGRECSVVEVRLNGIVLSNNTESSDVIIKPFYTVTDKTITLMTLRYVPMLSGVSQAVFNVDGERITKTILEIGL